ncbi:MAG: hypothetical protein U0271_34675 [Polyangiaceae bacterium]
MSAPDPKSCFVALGFTFLAACSVDLGDIPATCSDGECPEGYDCIRGTCAKPGTPIPTTIVELGYLRAGDMMVVPQTDSALVLWETYPYDTVGQSIRAKRLYADGSTGDELVLDDTWQADPGAVEPFFSAIALSDTEVLFAISSSPVEVDDPRPRIRAFRAEIPGPGQSGVVSSAPTWPDEVRMHTIGYGNVSQPRFVQGEAAGLELGYFEGIASAGTTSGRLAVFELDPATGELLSTPPACPVGDTDCCPATNCMSSVRMGAIAAGVASALPTDAGVVWTIDETRPSCIVTIEQPASFTEAQLDTLAIPLAVDGSSLLFLTPSARTGEGLPNDPVTGPATLSRLDLDTKDATEVGGLPTTRDTPRPVVVSRPSDVLVVTPGETVDSPTLEVFSIDRASGESTSIASIPRLSTIEISTVGAVLSGDRLFVAWTEISDDKAVIRAAVIDAP